MKLWLILVFWLIGIPLFYRIIMKMFAEPPPISAKNNCKIISIFWPIILALAFVSAMIEGLYWPSQQQNPRPDKG
jgi:hypothetical protein